MKIGIIDSGIGGLTIFNKLIKKFPKHSFYYVADKQNFPYGKKSKEELTGYLDDILSVFNDFDLILIACFTASTIIDKSNYKFKIITVVDVINNYFEKNDEVFSIIGTEHTINSDIFIKDFIQKIDGSELIKKIELGLKYDHQWLNKVEEVLILGCTHFNHLPELEAKSVRSDQLFANFLIGTL